MKILRTVRKAMPAKARLLILEMLVPEDGKPHVSKLLDVVMMSLFGGGRAKGCWDFSVRREAPI